MGLVLPALGQAFADDEIGHAARPLPGDMGGDVLLQRECRGSSGYIIAAALRAPYVRHGDAVRALGPCGGHRWSADIADGRASLAFGGLCTFRNAALEEESRAAHRLGAIERWRMVMPDGGSVDGAFRVTVLRPITPCPGVAALLFELGCHARLRFRAA